MEILRFDNYEKTQKEKMKIFAKHAFGKVLDIGGTQYQNPFLNDTVKAYLVDIVAPKKLAKNYIDFDKVDLNMEKIPYPDSCFDTVILGDVIEHLKNPLNILEETKRILKNEGILLISTPSREYYLELFWKLFFGRCMDTNDKYGHINLYSRKDLKSILEGYGFEIRNIIGYSFWIPVMKVGFVNSKRTFPEILTWQQIYVCEKVRNND